MGNTVQEIISDAEIDEVHGYANFGSMDNRTVVNEGVLKSAFGYWHGSTARAILREHRLIRKNDTLTAKGFRYLQALKLYSAAGKELKGK